MYTSWLEEGVWFPPLESYGWLHAKYGILAFIKLIYDCISTLSSPSWSRVNQPHTLRAVRVFDKGIPYHLRYSSLSWKYFWRPYTRLRNKMDWMHIQWVGQVFLSPTLCRWLDIFSKGNARCISIIATIVCELEKFSGLLPNVEKSGIYFLVTYSNKLGLAFLIGFSIHTLPFNHLGMLLLVHDLWNADCMLLLNQLWAKFTKWRTNKLLHVGRHQLVH